MGSCLSEEVKTVNINKNSNFERKLTYDKNTVVSSFIIKIDNQPNPQYQAVEVSPLNEPVYIWTNKAGVSWMLVLEEGKSFKFVGSPYKNSFYVFNFDEEQNVKSFNFGGLEYMLVEPDSSDCPITGKYERSPIENDWHVGEITQYTGNINPAKFFKENLLKSFAWPMIKKQANLADDDIENYAKQIISVETFFLLENMLKVKDYAAGYKLIEDYFSSIGGPTFFDPNLHVNFGNPVALYGLIMFAKIFEFYHIESKSISNSLSIDYYFTIVLVGKSHGRYPNTVEEINDPSSHGPVVHHTLIPDLLKNDYKIIRDCLPVFINYIQAISGGVLNVKLNFVYLDSVDVLCEYRYQNDMFYCEMAHNDEGEAKIKNFVPKDLANKTNLWFYIYPDHRNWENPNLNKIPFIVTGGCLCSEKPVLIADDRWFFKDFGSGSPWFSFEERKIYLTQWLKHEYYHYLFNVAFKEFQLEKKGHDWFDRSLWPGDFEGTVEPEYYDQSLRKRFINCDTPIWMKLSCSIGNILKTGKI
jgi:hypothetical protein